MTNNKTEQTSVIEQLKANRDHSVSIQRAVFANRFQRFSLNAAYQKALALAWADYCRLALQEATKQSRTTA